MQCPFRMLWPVLGLELRSEKELHPSLTAGPQGRRGQQIVSEVRRGYWAEGKTIWEPCIQREGQGPSACHGKFTTPASCPWTGGLYSLLSVSLRTSLGGWLHPTKPRLLQGARPAMCWRNFGHTQGGLQPGQEVASLVPPRPSGQIWLCRSRPPAAWGAQLACLEEPSTIRIFSHFIPVAPRDQWGQPRSVQPSAKDSPPPRANLVYTLTLLQT